MNEFLALRAKARARRGDEIAKAREEYAAGGHERFDSGYWIGGVDARQFIGRREWLVWLGCEVYVIEHCAGGICL